MKKIERNIKSLRNVLKIMEQLEDEIAGLDYYTTNQYFDKYLEKEKNTISDVIEVMENMKNDEDLLEEEEWKKWYQY